MKEDPRRLAASEVGGLDKTRPDLSTCPSDDIITAHLAGKLDKRERERFTEHLDGCDACRSIVMHAVRAMGVPVSSQIETVVERRDPDAKPDEVPHRVGRFTILNQLGAGGMGVVYAAYDTQLDRKVAVKLVRTDLHDAHPNATRKAMLREAKAMAKVEHPNVITVYEVGTFDDRVFLAMELVSGGDLRAWTATRPAWRDVLEVCVQAGKGLAAAHRASLVHRDFKPDNILIGRDGRARVTDFGLARPVVTPSEPALEIEPPAPSASMSDRLTRTGAIVGTPAYMAPEQHHHEVADERSDQFAFCVTVWEALYGERPFQGATYLALVENIQSGSVREPPRATTVPPRIRAALRRGLSIRPEDRFPSMDALLEVLADNRKTVWIAAAAGVGLVAVAASVTWFVTSSRGAIVDAECPDPQTKLANIWDPTRRATTEQALVASGPFGAEVARQTTKSLDTYAGQWAASWRDACQATYERGEQSATMFDLRVACLTRRLQALDTFVGTLANSDAVLAAKASTLAGALEPVAPCDDPTSLARMTPPTPAVKDAVTKLEATLAGASALQIKGRYDELRPLLEQAAAEAKRIGYRPLLARALYGLGSMQVEVGDLANAEKSLQAASSEAIAANDDWLAAAALIELVDVVGYELGRPAEARRLGDLATASLERAGNPKLLRVSLLNTLSRVYVVEGKHAEALAAVDQALALADESSGNLVTSLSTKGMVLYDVGRYDEARVLNERELALRLKTEGPRHPNYAGALGNRANLYLATNELDKAAADLHEARRIRVAAFGPNTSEIVGIENNLGVIAGQLGDWDEALRASRVALALYERNVGPKHPDTAMARSNVGAALRELGKLTEAEAELTVALQVREQVLGPDHQAVAASLHEMGELRLAQKRPLDAIPLFERVQKIFATTENVAHVAYATSGIGRARLATKDPKLARETLTVAVSSFEQSKLDPVALSETRLALAEATWQLGERAAAIVLATKAGSDLVSLPATANKPLRVSITRWLATHR